MLRSALLTAASFAFFIHPAWSSPIDDLTATLKGRLGTYSDDRRHDVRVLGIKVGCKGDTVEASITITDVTGKVEGDTAVISLSYKGRYYRQGWSEPCVKVDPALHGLEERKLHGIYTFRVTAKPFLPPQVSIGEVSKLGEMTGPKHDSNVSAVCAVRNAIASAYRSERCK